MIHKAAKEEMRAQRGHRGCTKGAQRVHKGGTSAGVDARVGSTVKARVKHVIDRGEGTQSARHLVLALVSEGKSNSRLLQGVKGRCPSYSKKEKGKGESVKEKIVVQDARS